MKKVLLAALLIPLCAAAQLSQRNDGYNTYTWAALTEASTGVAVNSGSWRGPKTVTVDVVTQAGESVTIQGSNDGTVWFTLTAASLSSGVYLSLTGITADAVYLIIEDPLFIRPLMTNVGGSGADFDVTLGGLR